MRDAGLKAKHSVTRGALSWTIFLLFSLAAMSAALLRMSQAGPSGTPFHPETLASSGIVALHIGPQPSVTAPMAYVFDPDSGFVYYAKDADREHPMASTTKVMTLLLALERGSLDQTITIGPDAAALVNPDSSYMGVSAGEKLTLRDLLYGLVLPSGNDAAVAIADALGGNVDKFVAMMNDRAKSLGLTHTHYSSPNGLDDTDNYTSARDLAVLSADVLRIPEAVTITSALHYSIPKTDTHKSYELQTGNDLLSGARSPYPGAIGVKPGFTYGAMFCMSFAARRHGRLIVGAVLDEPSWQVRIDDMRALLDWGFEQEGIPPAPPVKPFQPISANA